MSDVIPIVAGAEESSDDKLIKRFRRLLEIQKSWIETDRSKLLLALEGGHILLAMKAKHWRTWGAWVKENLRISEDQADKWMRLAQNEAKLNLYAKRKGMESAELGIEDANKFLLELCRWKGVKPKKCVEISLPETEDFLEMQEKTEKGKKPKTPTPNKPAPTPPTPQPVIDIFRPETGPVPEPEPPPVPEEERPETGPLPPTSPKKLDPDQVAEQVQQHVHTPSDLLRVANKLIEAAGVIEGVAADDENDEAQESKGAAIEKAIAEQMPFQAGDKVYMVDDSRIVEYQVKKVDVLDGKTSYLVQHRWDRKAERTHEAMTLDLAERLLRHKLRRDIMYRIRELKKKLDGPPDIDHFVAAN